MASADWRLEGEWLKNCNCAFGCPCDFNAKPTNGECEGLVAMRITKGHFNDVSLDGLHFAVTVHFPGPLHEGNGDAQPILDERASPEQRNALSGQMLTELVDALRRCRDDEAVRAVVLTGAGDRVFCAGADLGGFAADVPLVSKHFASDHFQGRETLMRGQKMAAEYLASQYRLMNVAPKGTTEVDDPRALDNYYQPFTVHGHRLTEASLSLYENEGENEVTSTTYSLGGPDGHSFVVEGNIYSSEGGVLFAGYGIGRDDQTDYDDYAALQEADLSVNGKWLLFFRDEPMDEEGRSLITEDGYPSQWTEQWALKLQWAFGSGVPAGVLVVADTPMDAALDGAFIAEDVTVSQ
jgi:hypothetical protein